MAYRNPRRATDLSVQDAARWLDTVAAVRQELRQALRDYIVEQQLDGRDFSCVVQGNGLFELGIRGMDQQNAQKIRRAWSQDFPESARLREASVHRSNSQAPSALRSSRGGAATPESHRGEDRHGPDRHERDRLEHLDSSPRFAGAATFPARAFASGAAPRGGNFVDERPVDRARFVDERSERASVRLRDRGRGLSTSQDLSNTIRSASSAGGLVVEMLQVALDRVAECGHHRHRDVYLWVKDVLPQDVWEKLWELRGGGSTSGGTNGRRESLHAEATLKPDVRRGVTVRETEFDSALPARRGSSRSGEEELVSFSRAHPVPGAERSFSDSESSDASSAEYYGGSQPSRPLARRASSQRLSTSSRRSAPEPERSSRQSLLRAANAEAMSPLASASAWRSSPPATARNSTESWLDYGGSGSELSPHKVAHDFVRQLPKTDEEIRRKIGRAVMDRSIDGAKFEGEVLHQDKLKVILGVDLDDRKLMPLLGHLKREFQNWKQKVALSEAARRSGRLNHDIQRSKRGSVFDC